MSISLEQSNLRHAPSKHAEVSSMHACVLTLLCLERLDCPNLSFDCLPLSLSFITWNTWFCKNARHLFSEKRLLSVFHFILSFASKQQIPPEKKKWRDMRKRRRCFWWFWFQVSLTCWRLKYELPWWGKWAGRNGAMILKAIRVFIEIKWGLLSPKFPLFFLGL